MRARRHPLHRPSPRQGASRLPHVVLAAVVAGISIYSYCTSPRTNPVTGEHQRVFISPQKEIAIGRQAAPAMMKRYKGLHPDANRQSRADRVGREILAAALGDRNPYPFEFHVLRDERILNAFALPGGQVFITAGLLDQLPTDGQLAGVLAHEIAHVVERHSAERLAKSQLTKEITGAVVLSSDDPDDPETQRAAQVALALGKLINMKYGREDELEADRDGVYFMAKAGYNPLAMLEVIKVLKSAGQGRTAEFFSTHPDPDRRIQRIQETILQLFPEQIPATTETLTVSPLNHKLSQRTLNGIIGHGEIWIGSGRRARAACAGV